MTLMMSQQAEKLLVSIRVNRPILNKLLLLSRQPELCKAREVSSSHEQHN